jgi:hypothetical protein
VFLLKKNRLEQVCFLVLWVTTEIIDGFLSNGIKSLKKNLPFELVCFLIFFNIPRNPKYCAA